jgi:hypothetical protein
MLHACVERFDVMGVRGNILGWDGEVNKAKKCFYSWDLNMTSLMHGSHVLAVSDIYTSSFYSFSSEELSNSL